MSDRLADAWYDDQAGPIVRLYAMTGGRAGATDREFTVSTMVTRAGDRTVGVDLPEEKTAILRLCAEALSVAEIAAHLSLPLSTVGVLLGDLRRAGLVRTPEQPAEAHLSADLMRRLRDGLLAL
jgi:DNA-binding transcriptional ArsR family regulator